MRLPAKELARESSEIIEKLTGKECSATVKNNGEVSISDYLRTIDPEERCLGVFSRFEGEMPGFFLMMVPEEEYMDFSRDIMENYMKNDEGLSIQIMEELGNIISSHILSILSDRYGKTGMHTPPVSALDMAGSFIQSIALYGSQGDERIMMTEIELRSGEKRLPLEILFIPSEYWR